jgi:GAF domain-containing protein
MDSMDLDLLESEYEIKFLKKLLKRERLAKEICAELNNFVDIRSTLISVLGKLKILANDCESIAVRLESDGDYPYFVYQGFSSNFILHENSLCSRDGRGFRIRSQGGIDYELDCMCGRVIKGQYDKSLDFFTDKGSFWTNDSASLLEREKNEKNLGETRDYCYNNGYFSVALIPIKSRGQKLGLVQFNDHRKNVFDEDLILFLEMLCENIGLAIENSLIYTKLEEKYSLIKHLEHPLTICPSCKSVKIAQDDWENITEFLRITMDIEAIDEFCSDCLSRL